MTALLVRQARGFSIVELVVVVAVMAVLLTIAIPTYQQYTQRAERADAIRAMLAVAGCQERIRASLGQYDTTQCLDGATIDTYRLRIEPADISASSEFTVFAEPVRNVVNTCGTLSLDHTGARGISSEEGSLAACWSGR